MGGDVYSIVPGPAATGGPAAYIQTRAARISIEGADAERFLAELQSAARGTAGESIDAVVTRWLRAAETGATNG